MKYYEISAKEDKNVKTIFTETIDEFVNNRGSLNTIKSDRLDYASNQNPEKGCCVGAC